VTSGLNLISPTSKTTASRPRDRLVERDCMIDGERVLKVGKKEGCPVGCPVGTLFVFTGTTTAAASMHGLCCDVSLTMKDTLRAFPLFLNCLHSSPLEDAVAMDTLTVLVRLAMNSWLELFVVTV
jgi:hypothetical protein